MKLIKKQMYGRASFELLRRRFLGAVKLHRELLRTSEAGQVQP
jgi:hypothetical protein